MTDTRSYSRGFTLVEVIVVLIILSVITTTAAVALGKMFSMSRETRVTADATQTTRSALLDLCGEIRSSESVWRRAGETKSGDATIRTDTLVYAHNGKPGDPHKPARECTIRLLTPAGPDAGGGLVKEIRSELRGEGGPMSTEILIPDAVEFEVKCLTDRGWTSSPRGEVYAVSLTVRVVSGEARETERVYTTSVNVPRALWQGGASLGEVQDDV